MLKSDMLQRNYFNKSDHQYQPSLILYPKKHVILETELILKKIDNVFSNIVDFGAGSGRLTIPLLQSNRSVTAVDISEKSLIIIKRISAQIKKSKYLKTAKTLKKNEIYKVITGTDVLHHINIDIYLPFFYNHLQQGGRIVFSEPNPFNISWIIFITLFIDWRIEKEIFKCNIFNLSRLLSKSRFKNIRVTGLGLFPLPLFNGIPLLQKINIFLGNLEIFKLFAYRLLIYAEK